jgi:carboxyl-terminal processing protease
VRTLWQRRRGALLVAGTAVLVLVLAAGFRLAEDDFFFRVSKGIDIFGRVYREVATNYVEDVDPERFMESGIDGMLATLDPYTTFYNDKQGDEVELITSGKYGGIGITIGVREGKITIINLMEGYSAQRQGLQPGDHIIAVDGAPIVNVRTDNVRGMTRGPAGSQVRVLIERDGEPKPLEFVLVREEIQLKNVTYAGLLDGGVGYIRLERFSSNTGDEVAAAIHMIQAKGEVKGMILDLRDNPGGLLTMAVNVVEKFVAKGSLVVSMKGRRPESEKKFFAAEGPMLPDVPLVVLINRNSASASEIVAGAIQDLDRGVILGTRSFGKGLVQTITPLVYNTQLKITTAKYYTPSGRCIQEIDYAKRNIDSVLGITPDSLRKEFRTAKGRPEYERGGIHPDTLVDAPAASRLQTELLRKAMFYRFALWYANQGTAQRAAGDEKLFNEFRMFLEKEKFTWQSESEAKLEELAALALKGSPAPGVAQSIETLRAQLHTEQASALDREKKRLLIELKVQLASRLTGERGRIEASLDDDVQVASARGLLLNTKAYERRLAAGAENPAGH